MKSSGLLKKVKTKNGLTLVELIVALALTIVVLGVILTFFIVSNKNMKEASIKSDLQREGKVAMELLTRNIMEAKSIDKLEFVEHDSTIKTLGLRLIKLSEEDVDRVEFSVSDNELNFKKGNINQRLSTKIKSIKLNDIDSSEDYSNNSALEKLNNDTNVLNLEIIVEDKGMKYKLSNNIVLRNFDSVERK